MNSRMLACQVWHARYTPVRHEFSYPVLMLDLDLAELQVLDSSVRGFGYNRFSVLSIHDRDYGPIGSGTIEDKLRRFLSDHPLLPRVCRVSLITAPRYFGYTFNPVSFYICWDSYGRVLLVVAEVNNTFGERHNYLLENTAPESAADSLQLRWNKDFYVSPFFDRSGWYDMGLKLEPNRHAISLNLNHGDRQVLATTLRCDLLAFSTPSLMRCLARLPLSGLLTMLRIHWQAVRLGIFKKLPLFAKPDPCSSRTIRSDQAGLWIKARLALMRNALKCVGPDLPLANEHRRKQSG